MGLSDPARFTTADIGPDYHQVQLDTDRELTEHVRQIQDLGFAVTITKAA
jgi:hypothetical protein